jgi:hypothetical protein
MSALLCSALLCAALLCAALLCGVMIRCTALRCVCDDSLRVSVAWLLMQAKASDGGDGDVEEVDVDLLLSKITPADIAACRQFSDLQNRIVCGSQAYITAIRSRLDFLRYALAR